ncbi:MAG TPA: hypothetical protein VHF25_08840 [Nitriliruptorales bacterium]|nr:hypothetical protein [Nitriliruptorales bacterium]
MNRENPHTATTTHNLAACPYPSGMATAGCHRSNCTISPGP